MKKSIFKGMFILFSLWATAALADWSQPIRLSEPGGNATPQILANGDTLHVVAENTSRTDKISYWRSTNGGLTWSPNRVLSDDSCQTLSPRIIGDGARIMALWKNHFYYGGTRSNNIGYSLSTNNGLTWTPTRYVSNPAWEHILYFASSGHDLDVNIVLNSQVGDSLVFYSIRSTDFGQTWSAPLEMFRTLQSGVPDQAGIDNFVHLSWAGCYHLAEPWETYYIRSTDGGYTWSENVLISSQDRFNSYWPAIFTDSPGSVVISWMDFKYSPYQLTGDIFYRESIDSGSIWNMEVPVTSNHFAEVSDIISDGDTVHIAWEDYSQGLIHRSIYYTRSTDNGNTWSDPHWVDGTLDDSANPALAVSNGRVYCVWTDGRANPDTNIIGGLYISRWDPEPDAINEGPDDLPLGARLSAYPNPFNSSVIITYSNEGGGDIGIFDVQGKLVKTLKTEGRNNGKIIWDATDASSEKVSSGIYFARARTSHNSIDLKLLYVK